MTVAYAARTPFVGSRLHREEEPRYAWERPGAFEPMVPASLAAGAIEEAARTSPEPRPRKSAPRPRTPAVPCPTCDGPTWSKGEGRRFCPTCKKSCYPADGPPKRTARTVIPCPYCAGPTLSKGRDWRRCRDCRRYHRPGQQPRAPEQPPAAAAVPQPSSLRCCCPACDGPAVTIGGAHGQGAWRRCKRCGERFRTHPPNPPRRFPPCAKCGGPTRSGGYNRHGGRRLQCVTCRYHPTPPSGTRWPRSCVIDLGELPRPSRLAEAEALERRGTPGPDVAFLWIGVKHLIEIDAGSRQPRHPSRRLAGQEITGARSSRKV